MSVIEKLYRIKKKYIKNLKQFYSDYFTIEGTYTSLLPDKIYLKKLYKKKTGQELNLKNPVTFNEKLNWLKLYDRRPEYTMMVDKYRVREFIKEKIGEEYLVPLLGVYNRVEEIDFDALPNQFVLKCNHDSEVVICKDKENNDFMCKKGKLNDIDEVKAYLQKRHSINYHKASREWPYKNVHRKIICEKFMVPCEEGSEVDYKLLCFNGKVKLIALYKDRFLGALTEDYYTKDWEYIKILDKTEAGDVYPKPEFLEEMIKVAEVLSEGKPFLRVDFNNWEELLAVGELTFFPHGGMLLFFDEWETKLGTWIELPKKKRRAQ